MISESESEAVADLLPDHLKEGWKAYQEWWVARYRSGDPLPTGGVFVLNKNACLMDELFRLHVEAANGLGIPFDNVQVDLDIDIAGRPVPKVDVRPPEGWIPDVPKHVVMAAGDRQKMANDYVSGYLNVIYRQMQERLTVRIRSLDNIREDVAPKEVLRAKQGENRQSDTPS